MTTEIILNNQYHLDPDENLNILFTYQVGDIRTVLSRNSSYSKTVSIVGSPKNNIAFGNLFDIRTYSDFNPNKKTPVLVKNGGIQIFKGYLKVDSIKITNESLITYECTMYSEFADLFTDLGSLKLSQLDLTQYNHNYNRHNVTGSWETFIVENGIEKPARYGEGYVYPYVDAGYGSSKTNIKQTEFFKPSFYALTIWNKIFDTSKFKYKSNFLNSDYFKRLIIVPSVSTTRLSDKVLTKSKLWASEESATDEDTDTVLHTYTNNTPDSYTIFSTDFYGNNPSMYNHNSSVYDLKLPNTSTGGRYDNGNNFDLTRNVYTVPETGFYTINAEISLDNIVYNTNYADGAFLGGIERYSVNQTFGCALEVTGATLDRFGHHPIYNLSDVPQSQTQSISAGGSYNGIPLGERHGSVIQFLIDNTNDNPYFLYKGDQISIKVSSHLEFTKIEKIGAGTYDFLPKVDFVQSSPCNVKIELVQDDIIEGYDWNFTNYISNDYCKDYILSICKMFNLYFEFDSDDENTLIIEPRKDFYNGNVVDWTYKMDRSNENEIFPMAEISAKNIHFLYKSDSDYFNNKYQVDNISSSPLTFGNSLTYGELTYQLDNDFVDRTSEDKIDLIFAPTPLAQETVYSYYTGGTLSSSSKVISTIFQSEDKDGIIIKKPVSSSSPRILFYNGMIDCDEWGLYDDDALYYFYTGGGIPPTNSVLTKYPYAGHLDNPFTPNEDLNFTYPLEYFYKRNAITHSNLFNKYWLESIQEIEDRSSTLMVTYLYLTSADIQALSFRNIIYLDSQYWIINKIIDYNPQADVLTKVELVKLINYGATNAKVSAAQQSINLNPNHTTTVQVGTNSSIIGAYNQNTQPTTIVYNNYIPLSSSTFFVHTTGDTMSGGLIAPSLSATTLSGGTIFSGGTDLSNLFATISGLNAVSSSLSAYTSLLTFNSYTGATNTQINALNSSFTGYTASTSSTLTGLQNQLNTKANLSGATFTGQITVPTISATTYLNLPKDVFTTGGTYSNGTTIFANSTGGTFSVSGFYTGYTAPTDIFTTGGTYSNGTATFGNSTGGTFSVTGFSTSTGTSFTGGTVSGATNFTSSLSASTYYSGSTSLQTIISNMIAAVPPNVAIGSTLFVSTSGSDITGTRGNLSFPFKTINGALSAATTGDTVFVFAGTFTETGLFKDGINYYFANGATISPSATTSIFQVINPTKDFNVDGFLTISSSQNGCAFDIQSNTNNVNYYLKFKSITMTNATGSDSIAGPGTVARTAIRFAGSQGNANIYGDIKITSTLTANGGGGLAMDADAVNLYYNGNINMTSTSCAFYSSTSSNPNRTIVGNFTSAGATGTIYLNNDRAYYSINGTVINTSYAAGVFGLNSNLAFLGGVNFNGTIQGNVWLQGNTNTSQNLNGAINAVINAASYIRLSSGNNNLNLSVYNGGFYIDGGINVINGNIVWASNGNIANVGALNITNGTTYFKANSTTFNSRNWYPNLLSGGLFRVCKDSNLYLSSINAAAADGNYGINVNGGTMIVEGVIDYSTAVNVNLAPIKLTSGTLVLDSARIINRQTGTTACSISAITNQNIKMYNNSYANFGISGATLTNVVTNGGSLFVYTGLTE